MHTSWITCRRGLHGPTLACLHKRSTQLALAVALPPLPPHQQQQQQIQPLVTPAVAAVSSIVVAAPRYV